MNLKENLIENNAFTNQPLADLNKHVKNIKPVNEMNSYSELTKNLSSDHRNRLNWFYEKRNTIIPWPTSDNFYLATKAKGIYKPKNFKYVLSIRENINSLYPDRKPIINKKDNSWSYEYFQEGFNLKSNLFTNIAMKSNIRDSVPIAVFIQVKEKPYSRYEVLGIGIIKSQEDTGHFIIESCK